MRVVYCILITIFLSGCNSLYKIVDYEFNETERIKIGVPKNFVFEGLQGNHELEHRYWYSDSSVIYITTFENTVNYEEIRKQDTYYKRFNAFHSKDTLTVCGVKDELYWKDKLLETGITIGYSRVPKNKLEEFENVILSIKK